MIHCGQESWLGHWWTLVFLLAGDMKRFLFEGNCCNTRERLRRAVEGSPSPNVTSLHRHPPVVSFDELRGPFQPSFLPSFLQEECLQFLCPLQTATFIIISGLANWANVIGLILRLFLWPSGMDCFPSVFLA